MKLRLLFASLLTLGLPGNGAFADISGGPVYAGDQTYVRCMVYNAGPGTATITGNFITTGGEPIVLDADSCGATLAPGKLCVIAGLVGDTAHACRIRGSGGVLRGTIAVYVDGNLVRHSADLR